MATKPQLRILLVDDDVDTVHVVRYTLQKVDPATVLDVAGSREELITHLERAVKPYYNLLLLDLMLEGEMNGLALVDLIRSYPNTRLMPIIALSFRDDHQTVQASYQRRVNSYLQKPETLEEWERVMLALTNYWKVSALPSE
ncbi:response regulator [Rudanella paleaurantiibacter]|uniref:Response regulator n=1 Tax=Rudanella paleaurantiibacter TaxID=2614655 RepID=A0A7J5TYI6_9BACT|nr:response regulator [Rudanella paleaurantiibacter]KAB7730125.1 response regulator [Rudanella paleaurantiibacter]